jgi:phosphoglycerol transferase MdoB-like AlkP superfamily enzyme
MNKYTDFDVKKYSNIYKSKGIIPNARGCLPFILTDPPWFTNRIHRGGSTVQTRKQVYVIFLISRQNSKLATAPEAS